MTPRHPSSRAGETASAPRGRPSPCRTQSSAIVSVSNTSGLYPADRGDVCMDLRDQRVDRLEASLVTQAVEELEPDPAIIEVAVEVEQVGLDAHRRPRARTGEGRVASDAQRRLMHGASQGAVEERGARRVDSELRHQLAFGGEVGGRKPE